jgi:hypothetical protein
MDRQERIRIRLVNHQDDDGHGGPPAAVVATT